MKKIEAIKKTEKQFALINKLKNEFKLTPNIDSVKDIIDLHESSNKEIVVTHLICGRSYTINIDKWLNSKKNQRFNTESISVYSHFCKECTNDFKRSDLQDYINSRYNKEFALNSAYISNKSIINVTHIECGHNFIKTPNFIKSKRLFCPNCGKSDSLYEQDIINKKNLELKNRMTEKDICNYEPTEDCSGFSKSMKFKHSTCGNIFTATPRTVIEYYSKTDFCPNCPKNERTSSEKERDSAKIRARYRKFKSFLDEFHFSPEIHSIDEFKELYTQIFTITHKDCGKSVNAKIPQWIQQKNILSNSKSRTKFCYLCAHCSEEIKRNDLQNHLNEKFNNEFVIESKYTGMKTPLNIKHTSCGNVFSATPNSMKNRKLICPHCGKTDTKTELKKQQLRNKELKAKLTEKGLSNFEPLEDITGLAKEVRFKHDRCGNTFLMAPKNLLKSSGRKYCPNCPEKLLSTSEDVHARNNYAQDAMSLLNGDSYMIEGFYDDNDDYVDLRHNKCSNVFTLSKRNLFSKKIICPHCESNNLKNNKFISISQKIELYEAVLDNKYKILKPFLGDEETVPFMHVECGHIFERTISMYLRSKDKLFCPECKNKIKLNKIKNDFFNTHGGIYSIVDIEDYTSCTKAISFMHNDCGTVFESTYKKMISSRTMQCPRCNPPDKALLDLKSQVHNKYKGEYIVKGDFNGNHKKTTFRHVSCGRIFTKTPRYFFSSDIPCTHCQRESIMLGLKDAQSKVELKSGKLFTLNGVYRGVNNELPVTCNKCKKVFTSSPKNMFRRAKCPLCKSHSL